MKRLLPGFGALVLIGAAVAFSATRPPRAEFEFAREERNPITHFNLNNAPDDFQFAIVSDRTGGHRPRVFSQAVEQLNLLQPEFVVSVGDLIEGYTEDTTRLNAEWREFQSYVARLQMPFFYVPGNHDITNAVMDRMWREKFGRRWYHFVYRDVLFLMLNSEDPPGHAEGRFSAAQRDYVRQALADNPSVRWTLVFFHKPTWIFADVEKTGWLDIESLLEGRKYTVFAGHVHRYQKFVRNGQNYYMLATTGGVSKLRGTDYGEFDHIVWVTMKQDGPVLANVLTDGIFFEDMRQPITTEEGYPPYNRRPTHAVAGKVFFEGKPVPQAYVVFQSTGPAGTPSIRADAFTDEHGAYTLSTYAANDGAPAGEYSVAIVWRKPFYEETGKPGPNHLPEQYAQPATSPLKAVIQSGQNVIDFDLKK